MSRRIVFGLLSVMGLLCAGQTLHADVAICLIAIEPKSCADKFGAWPGFDENAFACGANICGATVPPSCSLANTWRTNLNEEGWFTEQPDYTTPISPATGFNRTPTIWWNCKVIMGCVNCEYYVGDPKKPEGQYCAPGVKSRTGIQLFAKVNNTPCQGIEAP